jgi:hypothetical protein
MTGVGPRQCYRLVVDYSERNAPLLALARQSDKFDVQMARLDAGDYLVEGGVLIERKTYADFVRLARCCTLAEFAEPDDRNGGYRRHQHHRRGFHPCAGDIGLLARAPRRFLHNAGVRTLSQSPGRALPTGSARNGHRIGAGSVGESLIASMQQRRDCLVFVGTVGEGDRRDAQQVRRRHPEELTHPANAGLSRVTCPSRGNGGQKLVQTRPSRKPQCSRCRDTMTSGDWGNRSDALATPTVPS